jgi:crossover junction endodeoxyribonuclease RuvC
MILGIDIGAQGAVAIVDKSGSLLAIHDMPVLQDGPKGRRAVNAPQLAAIILKSHANRAFVEFVAARPEEGLRALSPSAEPTRRHRRSSCRRSGVAVMSLTPPAWKRAVELSLASKDASRAEAIRRWPDRAELFARVKDDGRAEAALIGVAGLMRKGCAR